MDVIYHFDKVLKMSDPEIVQAILNRNKEITFLYLYKKCYPIFNSAYRKYYTDCENPIELINEIYVYILTPNKNTGKCKLANFGFRCTLTMWVKIIVENYCRQLYARKKIFPDDLLDLDHRNSSKNNSFDFVDVDLNNLNRQDVTRVLDMMPNKRYRQLLIYRYLEEKTNEETAMLLNISMANFYNSHLRAKKEFRNALHKEGLI